MSDAPAAWYDDGAGRFRWWDGQSWTDNFRDTPMIPAGWYADPESPSTQRWWDGVRWAPSVVERGDKPPSANAISDSTVPDDLFELKGYGDVPVVGENYHREALDEFLAARKPGELGVAVLVPEPENLHDNRAVRVELLSHGKRLHIGYLSADYAGMYQEVLLPFAAEGRFGTVRANVWQGDSSIQVYLRLDEPDRILGRAAPVAEGVVLDARWSATVTGEEKHQDTLAAAYGNIEEPVTTLFTLGFTTIEKGKNMGLTAIAVFLDGNAVGQLTRMISARYEKDVSELLDAGKVPFAEGVIQRDSKNRLQVDLILPAHS